MRKASLLHVFLWDFPSDKAFRRSFASREHITPNDENQIPTGEFEPVQDTPFDFTVSRRIGNRIDEVKGGYDHNYVLFGMGRNAKFVTETGTVPGG